MATTEFIGCKPQRNEAGKYGYKNAKGKVVIPFEYDYILELRWRGTRYFEVAKENKRGIVDINNNIVVPLEYSYFEIKRVPEGIFIITMKNGKYGVLDLSEKTILPFEYDYLKDIYCSITSSVSLMAAKDEKWSLIDLFGNPIIPETYNQFYMLLNALENESYVFNAENFK